MDIPNTLINPYWLAVFNTIRTSPLEKLREFTQAVISAERLPHGYLRGLNAEDECIALRSCLLVFHASSGRMVPRQYQLESTIALAHRLHSVIDSGTGSGKTLCQIIPSLLYPDTTSITVSPLKRLQILQAAEFERWGIRTMCINEDTPSDPVLWDQIRNGYFQHLIIQPEQLRTHQGHLPRLARLLSIPNFLRTIARVHIDEAHNHHAAGLPLCGLPPFRPAWGALDELKMRLPKATSFQALSGTFPPHIKTAVIEHFNFDQTSLVSLKLSSNRPNTVYATHPIVGSLNDFRNLDFLIGDPFKLPFKVLVFHDDTQQCADAAGYQDKCLPLELQILASFDIITGLDVPDIVAVIDHGLPQKKNTSLQRGGRCGRCGRCGQLSVYLVMAEPWAYTASLDSVAVDSSDPDRPISGRLLKNSKKPERAGLAMIVYVRSETCLRKKIRDYLADVAVNALEVSMLWCCDRLHPGEPQLRFDKHTFFPGRFLYTDDTGAIYAGDVDEPDRVHLNPPKRKKRKAKGPPNRKVALRDPLQDRIRQWLTLAHNSDPLRVVRPASFILDAKSIKKLCTVHPDCMTSVVQVISTLEESDEWAAEWGSAVFSIISTFDEEMARSAPKKTQKRVVEREDHTHVEKRSRRQQVLSEVNMNVRRSSRLLEKPK
ncbi:II DNA helicase [Mycena vulgaris]|nr:II DNA helicase [Mycena vulgaris]